MEHLGLKASTSVVAEELGMFEALVSGFSEDRMGDVITPDAFDKTIEAWRNSGKYLPLLFEHTTKSVGSIDPESMHVTDEGLVVSGEVDRSTDEGEQTWRMIKKNTASFSIGFASESRPRKGGKGTEIYEVDLLEISFTSTPAHPSARTLNWKSTTAELRYESMRAAREATGSVAPPRGNVPEFEELRRERLAAATAAEEEADPAPVNRPRRRTIFFANGKWHEHDFEGDDCPSPSPEQLKEHEAAERAQKQQVDSASFFTQAARSRIACCGVVVDENGKIIS